MTKAKMWVALAGTVVTALLQAGLTGRPQQVLTVLAAVLTALLVYLTPNKPVPPT